MISYQICAFGFSQWKNYSDSHSINDINKQAGTVTHIPPEYWTDSRLRKMEYFDVYSFAILEWQVMTKEKPFKGKLFYFIYLIEIIFIIFCNFIYLTK